MIWALLLLLLLLGILVYGAMSVSSGVYLKCLCFKKGEESRFSITMDDGVDPIITPKVLDVLDKHNAKVTFFIIGETVELYPNLVLEIDKRGHNIGIHSYYHKGTFPLQSTSKIVDELNRSNVVLQRILNREIKLFRPPFGVTNPMISRAVKICGLTSIGWSIRSFDTLGHPLEKVYKRVIAQLKAGSVVLLHDNREGADILLDKILCYADQKALKSVTIDELFNIK